MSEHDVQKSIEKLRHKLRLDKLPKPVRVAIAAVVGGLCLLAGIVMIFTPGPAFVLIPLGLLLLASEFKWAEKWAQKAMDGIDRAREKWKAYRARRKSVRP